MRRSHLTSVSAGLAAVSLAVAAPAAAAPKAVGTFGDWAAFRDESGAVRCYIVSPPASTQTSSGSIRRGPAALSIGMWPGRGINGQIHVETGFPIDAGATSALRVGGHSFPLLPEGQSAWAENAAADEAIIAAMRRGSSAEVVTTSRRGTKVTDRYSLKGFSAALEAARTACRGGSGSKSGG